MKLKNHERNQRENESKAHRFFIYEFLFMRFYLVSELRVLPVTGLSNNGAR